MCISNCSVFAAMMTRDPRVEVVTLGGLQTGSPMPYFSSPGSSLTLTTQNGFKLFPDDNERPSDTDTPRP
jgi:hypothetical protein